MLSLDTKVYSLGGIYKRYANALEKLGIITLGDFLYHIPFRYDDFSLISKIGQIQPGEIVTIRGNVIDIKNQYTRRGFTIQKAKIKDDTGSLDVVWFNQPYIPKSISQGELISLSGKVEMKVNKFVIQSPDFEIGENDFIHTGRLVPVYPETRGVSSKWIRRQVYKLLNENKNEIIDYLPQEIKIKSSLPDLLDSLNKIHFPNNLDEAEKSKRRLAFDELFLMQLGANVRRNEWNKNLMGKSFNIKKHQKKINEFIKKLPFELTNAQKSAVDEIFNDLTKNEPMNRLLEGDVGSGKTVVAAVSIYLAYLNGFQSVFMAPTEILAQQHYRTISTLLEPMGLMVGLQTSNTKHVANSKLRVERNSKKPRATSRELPALDVLVGTHAVISEKVKFDKLGLVVIDEQQRFGVEQRSLLRKKGNNPHVLTMTATPIPRTIALTMYGDLGLSVLDEMPKGRKLIKTWLVPKIKREAAYEWIKKQINQTNTQVFIICPFIEESESMQTVKAATKEFEILKNVFKNYKLGLLHGKLKSKDKERVLNEFKNKKFHILVATPVVEVGIDIPDAGIIIIETSERFGLSQLHQLRGRVGRNDRQAYCLLFTDSISPQTQQRLKAMETTSVGSKLAEFDLKMRGPGEIYGTKQHGRKVLKVASFSDFDLIKKTREESKKIISELGKFPLLVQKIKEINTKQVSPD